MTTTEKSFESATESRKDETAIHELVTLFVEGWNNGSGTMCARPFAEDADFVAINGIHAQGRVTIGKGHDEILSTIFRGTTLAAEIQQVRFLRSDVASVNVRLSLKPAGQRWLPKFTSCGLVATKESGNWSIAVFRNMVPFERPVAGPLDRELLDARGAGAV